MSAFEARGSGVVDWGATELVLGSSPEWWPAGSRAAALEVELGHGDRCAIEAMGAVASSRAEHEIKFECAAIRAGRDWGAEIAKHRSQLELKFEA